MLSEWTREFVHLRPDVLVVYDRVAPTPEGKDYHWRLHVALILNEALDRLGQMETETTR